MSPNAKTEETDSTKRENDEAFFPNRVARKRGDQMGDEAEARKDSDVDLGLREKPEKTLPENRESGGDGVHLLNGQDAKRRKKVRVQKTIGEQAGAGREKNAEDEHAENGSDEPGPDGDWKTWKCKTVGAQVDRGDTEIDGVEECGGAEEGDAGDPESDAEVRGDEKGGGHADKRGSSGVKGKEVEFGEGHFVGADLEREEVAAESGLRGNGEHEKHHERAVKCGESGDAVWRIGQAGKQGKMQAGPNEVNSDEERHGHAEKHAEEGEPEVAKADGLVVDGVGGHGARCGNK